MGHLREGNVYPGLAACSAGRAGLSLGQPAYPRTSTRWVSPQPHPKTAQPTHKSNSPSITWRLKVGIK